MKTVLGAILLSALISFVSSIAIGAEFQEYAMCESLNPDASFPKISIQRDPQSSRRAILILSASDGWTQVYSGQFAETSKALTFQEDGNVVRAGFSKAGFTATISFNKDRYRCDERSFGS